MKYLFCFLIFVGFASCRWPPQLEWDQEITDGRQIQQYREKLAQQWERNTPRDKNPVRFRVAGEKIVEKWSDGGELCRILVRKRRYTSTWVKSWRGYKIHKSLEDYDLLQEGEASHCHSLAKGIDANEDLVEFRLEEHRALYMDQEEKIGPLDRVRIGRYAEKEIHRLEYPIVDSDKLLGRVEILLAPGAPTGAKVWNVRVRSMQSRIENHRFQRLLSFNGVELSFEESDTGEDDPGPLIEF